MKGGILICFMGIDGSGKTTLARELIADLKKRGISAEYRWGKFESSILRLLIFLKNKLVIRESNFNENYKKSLKLKNKLFSNKLVSKLYEWFVLIDYTIQIIFKVTLPLKLGKNVVCDRYVFDTIVDLALDLRYSDEKIRRRLNQLFRLLPRPDVLFFVDVPEEIAFRRKDDIPSLEFLKSKKEMYFKILEFLKTSYKFEIVDGTKPIQSLKKEIMEVLMKIDKSIGG